MALRALATALYLYPQFRTLCVVSHRVWHRGAGHGIYRVGEVGGLICATLD
jgi:hypothetical protein